MRSAEKRRIARAVYETMLTRHEGENEELETWLMAARLGCLVYDFHVPNGEQGDYTPACTPEGYGVITYNTAYTPLQQARVLCHEIAHSLLWPLVPGYLFGEFTRARYNDDSDDLRHAIAKMVEEMFFPAKKVRRPRIRA